MAFLLDHSLSREYNFVGRHGKREFRGLKLFEVIYGMFITIVLFIFARGYSAEENWRTASLMQVVKYGI